MRSSIDLKGTRVLVTGGSGVLGRNIAAELKERGATVVITGRDPGRLHEVATQLGADTQSITFDIGVDGHIEHVVSTAVQMMGGLDGVVNAIGVVAFGPLAAINRSALDELSVSNLIGPLKLAQEALPHVQNGFIVNITGVVAEAPVAGMAAYSAVKAGLSAATVALGRELRRQGILVLDARPPHTETGLAGRPIDGIPPQMPTGLDPKDVARTIVDGIETGKRQLEAKSFA